MKNIILPIIIAGLTSTLAVAQTNTTQTASVSSKQEMIEAYNGVKACFNSVSNFVVAFRYGSTANGNVISNYNHVTAQLLPNGDWAFIKKRVDRTVNGKSESEPARYYDGAKFFMWDDTNKAWIQTYTKADLVNVCMLYAMTKQMYYLTNYMDQCSLLGQKDVAGHHCYIFESTGAGAVGEPTVNKHISAVSIDSGFACEITVTNSNLRIDSLETNIKDFDIFSLIKDRDKIIAP